MSDLQTRRRPGAAGRRPQLRCSRAASDRSVHLALRGELDIATVPYLDRALRRAQGSSDVVVLDLGDLELIDSSGALLLLEANRQMRADGAHLLITRVTPEVEWFLALIGIDRLLEIV